MVYRQVEALERVAYLGRVERADCTYSGAHFGAVGKSVAVD